MFAFRTLGSFYSQFHNNTLSNVSDNIIFIFLERHSKILWRKHSVSDGILRSHHFQNSFSDIDSHGSHSQKGSFSCVLYQQEMCQQLYDSKIVWLVHFRYVVFGKLERKYCPFNRIWIDKSIPCSIHSRIYQ